VEQLAACTFVQRFTAWLFDSPSSVHEFFRKKFGPRKVGVLARWSPRWIAAPRGFVAKRLTFIERR